MGLHEMRFWPPRLQNTTTLSQQTIRSDVKQKAIVSRCPSLRLSSPHFIPCPCLRPLYLNPRLLLQDIPIHNAMPDVGTVWWLAASGPRAQGTRGARVGGVGSWVLWSPGCGLVVVERMEVGNGEVREQKEMAEGEGEALRQGGLANL